MPSVSRKQQKAMFAASEGRSTIGIPKSVGQEFAKADKMRTKHRHAARRKKEANKWAMNRKSNVGEYTT